MFSAPRSCQMQGAPRRNSLSYCDEVQRRRWPLIGVPVRETPTGATAALASLDMAKAMPATRRLAVTPVGDSEHVKTSVQGY